MNFITYINQVGTMKTALISGENPNFQTDKFIDEPYLVTGVFIDSVKQLVEAENPMQMAVINDNFFDGDVIGLNEYNQAGYFSCRILENNAISSNDSDVSALIPYLVNPYVHRYRVPYFKRTFEKQAYDPCELNFAFKCSDEDPTKISLYGMDMYSNISYAQRPLLFAPDVLKYNYGAPMRMCDLNVIMKGLFWSSIPTVLGKKILDVILRYNVKTNEINVRYRYDQVTEAIVPDFAHFVPTSKGFSIKNSIFEISIEHP